MCSKRQRRKTLENQYSEHYATIVVPEANRARNVKFWVAAAAPSMPKFMFGTV